MLLILVLQTAADFSPDPGSHIPKTSTHAITSAHVRSRTLRDSFHGSLTPRPCGSTAGRSTRTTGTAPPAAHAQGNAWRWGCRRDVSC